MFQAYRWLCRRRRATPRGLLKTAVRSPRSSFIFRIQAHVYVEGSRCRKRITPFRLVKADIKREGEDATIVAVGPMVQKSLEAAVLLEDEGYDMEVVDPRTLSPLDTETICESVRRTGRAVVCGEDSSFAGAVSEIAAMIGENCFGESKGAGGSGWQPARTDAIQRGACKACCA